MLKRSIRIAAAALAALSLAGGCVRTGALSTDQTPGTPIRFEAGSLLLRDDGASTKAGEECVLKEGDFVTDADAIAVYAARQGNGMTTIEFDGTVVSKRSAGWEYSPLRSWDWQTDGDYYDFIGVYPPSGVGTSRMDIPGNLAVETPYSLVADPADAYDLLYAVFSLDVRHGMRKIERNAEVIQTLNNVSCKSAAERHYFHAGQNLGSLKGHTSRHDESDISGSQDDYALAGHISVNVHVSLGSAGCQNSRRSHTRGIDGSSGPLAASHGEDN